MNRSVLIQLAKRQLGFTSQHKKSARGCALFLFESTILKPAAIKP